MIIFILYGLSPVLDAVWFALGYRFILRSYPLSMILLAVISLYAVVSIPALRITLSKTQKVFSALLLPLSAINGMYFVYKSNWVEILIFVLICCGCSAVMLIKYAGSIFLKIISAAVSLIFIGFLLYFSFIDAIFQDFGRRTVVKSIDSPQKRYTAEVIDNDEGALGGDTLVEIKENGKDVDLFVLKLTKAPIRIYTGDWGEFETMQTAWTDQHTILINGKEYSIND